MSCSSKEFFPYEIQKSGSSTTQNNFIPNYERGKYLVTGPANCGQCHSPTEPMTKSKYDRRIKYIDGKELSGKLMNEDFVSRIIAQNITPGGRIKTWSDRELKRAIREGIRPDGSLIGIPMPFSSYRNLSDYDVDSIIIYLRSLKPVYSDYNESSSYTIMRIAMPSDYGSPVGYIPVIDKKNKIEYGKYLAGPVAACVVCHTPLGFSPPVEHQYSKYLGKGGMEFKGPWGISIASNISNHPDALGRYNDTELKKVITNGITPTGMQLSQAMDYNAYKKMTESDLNALIAYLRTIPEQTSEE